MYTKEERKRRSQQYYLNNKDKIIVNTTKWRKDNPDKAKEIRKRYYRKNAEKLIKNKIEWQKANPDKVQIANRRNYEAHRTNYRNLNLKRNYGITLEIYNFLLEKQEGKCAVCGIENNGHRTFAVDHNHKTEKIRGLLCTNCNTGIGLMKDNIEILSKAITYLQTNL